MKRFKHTFPVIKLPSYILISLGGPSPLEYHSATMTNSL